MRLARHCACHGASYLLRCMSPVLAHSDASRQRSTSVAFGAKRTLTEPRLQKPDYDYTSSGSHRDRVACRRHAGAPTQRERPRAPGAVRPPRPPASSGWPSIRRGTGGRWRAASEAREQQRVAAKAELAAERRRVNVDEIEGIIRDAILREREFYSEVVAHVLGEALGRLDQEIKEKRDALASEDRLESMMSSRLKWELSRGKAAAAHARDEAEHAMKVFAIRVGGARGAAAVKAFEAARALQAPGRRRRQRGVALPRS